MLRVTFLSACPSRPLTVTISSPDEISSGLVETEACYGDLCHYEVMTSMMAKNYIYTMKKQLEVLSAIGQSFEEHKEQERIKQLNKSIIVKQVTVTTPKGEKISLQEDKNGDDYLVINGKRIETIGRGIATYKDVVYDPYPENSQIFAVAKLPFNRTICSYEFRNFVAHSTENPAAPKQPPKWQN